MDATFPYAAATPAPVESPAAGPTRDLKSIVHELRNPINGVLGFVELLLLSQRSQQNLTDQQLGYLGHLETASRALVHTLQHLMEPAREASCAPPAGADLQTHLRAVLAQCASTIEERQLDVQVRCPQELTLPVLRDRASDDRMIEALLTSLLGCIVHAARARSRVDVSLTASGPVTCLRVMLRAPANTTVARLDALGLARARQQMRLVAAASGSPAALDLEETATDDERWLTLFATLPRQASTEQTAIAA